MSKHHKTKPMHSSLFRAFQWYKEHEQRMHSPRDLIVTNKTNETIKILKNKMVWIIKCLEMIQQVLILVFDG